MYQIIITYPSGRTAYMVHRDHTAWCKRTAQKHLNEFVLWHGLSAKLEKA